MSEHTDEIFKTAFFTYERDRESDDRSKMIYIPADSFMAELYNVIKKLEAEIKNLREAGQADGDAIVAEKEKVDKLEAKLSHAIDCMDSDGEADHKCWVNWKYKEEKI